jgi:hypothetical protein
MKTFMLPVFLALPLFALVGTSPEQDVAGRVKFDLESIDQLEVHSAKLDGAGAPPSPTLEISSYLGRRAIKLVNRAGRTSSGAPANGETIAIVAGSDFGDGTIEASVVGSAREGAQPGVRGFVGIAFRVSREGSQYECFSLRQTNGRASDQLRRNHTTQYSAYPDFPWHRLREQNPGLYESYVDLDPQAWTKIRIVVSAAKARLYVNGAEQAALVVNDLKLRERHGKIALWVGTDTEGYFSDLIVEPGR